MKTTALVIVAVLCAAPAFAGLDSQNRTVTPQNTTVAPTPGATVTDGITAAGTTQATATVLTTEINYVTTTASGTGVILPSYVATGAAGSAQPVEVFNEGANALLVYPQSGGQIKAGTTLNTANAAITLAAGGHARFTRTSATLMRQGP